MDDSWYANVVYKFPKAKNVSMFAEIQNSDAAASDDRILAESYLQFADHYYRIHQEIEINNEAKETKLNAEKNNNENSNSEIEVENKDKNNNNRPPRRKRGYQIRETEMLAQEDENTKIIKEKENSEKNSNFDTV